MAMKATLGLEEIGHGRTQLVKRRNLPGIYVNLPGRGSFVVGRTPPPCWVAEIIGYDPITNSWQRQFLKGQRDYRSARPDLNRGVFLYFILKSGRVYEVNENLSWNRSRRYLVRVSEDGNIIEIPKSEVMQWLTAKDTLASTS